MYSVLGARDHEFESVSFREEALPHVRIPQVCTSQREPNIAAGATIPLFLLRAPTVQSDK